ncbi:MAG: DUF2278 family protein [candidate division Zixibacteria bacterium]|nr:DUF2278 family protein [candidate division Zixibacteria bacterium]MDH3936801.1 DUF2278 family protein [candidate division Zixibacteria bacterium]MDH4033214.1 DUF2278 family protein [candidate division Zixibacteria bacterium]
MPLKKYSVLKGHAIESKMERDNDTPHFQVRVDDGKHHHRISVNVKSHDEKAELLYLVDEDFNHPITSELGSLSRGLTQLAPGRSPQSLDFIRGNLFDPTQMQVLPHNVPGPDNDLNDKIGTIIQQAINDAESTLYAFGEPWGPDSGKDKEFHFEPKRGLHDIHMNQGNYGRHKKDNGVWQDGGLLLYLPTRSRWVAVFLAFQSQAWHTHDETGHPLSGTDPVPTPDDPGTPEHEGTVRIVAALVNPVGGTPEDETVTLINLGPDDVSLNEWRILDRADHPMLLDGTLEAGGTRVIHLPQDVQLSNKGGTITLLDQNNLKVHGVSYTKKQAKREGWTILF